MCFSVAAWLQPRAMSWGQRGQDSVLKVLMGDGRRVFADQLFRKADVYFHSGYYPSVFDANSQAPHESHMAGHEHEDEEHEKEADFLGTPRDWIEAFGRHFMITTHTHLEHGQEREILPWLKLSADLDPQNIDAYTVGAYFLSAHLGRFKEAEDFLQEGLRNNPDSYQILFSLGRIYNEKEHDPERTRNVWEGALRKWDQQKSHGNNPDKLALHDITLNLGNLEEKEGNYAKAIEYLERAKSVSPAPQTLQKQIGQLKAKAGGVK
jgi:tetratricopeptide (TPR) repeat protein